MLNYSCFIKINSLIRCILNQIYATTTIRYIKFITMFRDEFDRIDYKWLDMLVNNIWARVLK